MDKKAIVAFRLKRPIAISVADGERTGSTTLEELHLLRRPPHLAREKDCAFAQLWAPRLAHEDGSDVTADELEEFEVSAGVLSAFNLETIVAEAAL